MLCVSSLLRRGSSPRLRATALQALQATAAPACLPFFDFLLALPSCRMDQCSYATAATIECASCGPTTRSLRGWVMARRRAQGTRNTAL